MNLSFLALDTLSFCSCSSLGRHDVLIRFRFKYDFDFTVRHKVDNTVVVVEAVVGEAAIVEDEVCLVSIDERNAIDECREFNVEAVMGEAAI